MQPEIIYSDQNVMITKHIAVILGTSYPIGAISSLTVRPRTAANGCLPFFLVIIGGAFALPGTLIFLFIIMPGQEISV